MHKQSSQALPKLARMQRPTPESPVKAVLWCRDVQVAVLQSEGAGAALPHSWDVHLSQQILHGTTAKSSVKREFAFHSVILFGQNRSSIELAIFFFWWIIFLVEYTGLSAISSLVTSSLMLSSGTQAGYWTGLPGWFLAGKLACVLPAPPAGAWAAQLWHHSRLLPSNAAWHCPQQKTLFAVIGSLPSFTYFSLKC